MIETKDLPSYISGYDEYCEPRNKPKEDDRDFYEDYLLERSKGFMTDEIKLNDIADNLIIFNKITIDKIFQLENCADCIALYIFYYKTAKWQKTNTIKANDDYVKKSLKWGTDRIKRTKNILKESGLINIVQRRTNGKIDGWFIEVSYLMSDKNINQNTQNPQVVTTTGGLQETNALKVNIKCLKRLLLCAPTKKTNKKDKFNKPTLDEVIQYCQERKNNIDAEYFIDYYQSVGWKVGRNPMQDWKATVRTWERNEKNKNSGNTQKKQVDIYETI